jgi:hypothetical protein
MFMSLSRPGSLNRGSLFLEAGLAAGFDHGAASFSGSPAAPADSESLRLGGEPGGVLEGERVAEREGLGLLGGVVGVVGVMVVGVKGQREASGCGGQGDAMAGRGVGFSWRRE